MARANRHPVRSAGDRLAGDLAAKLNLAATEIAEAEILAWLRENR